MEENQTTEQKNRFVEARKKKREAEKRKESGGSRMPVLIGAITVTAIAAVYVGVAVYFNSHFFFNSTVNGADSSCASVAVVKERIKKAGDEYVLTITEKDGTTEEIASSDIDLAIDVDNGDVEKFLARQNSIAWIGSLFHPTEYKNDAIVSYDHAKLAAAVKALPCATRKDVTETKDAKFTFDGSSFVVVDEVYGTNVELSALTASIAEAVTLLEPELNLYEDKCYVQPQVTAESEELNALVDELNKKLNIKITYDVGETVPASEIAKWLVPGEDATLSFDDEAMAEYVAKMASEYNTAGKPHTLQTTASGAVTVDRGTYGWRIDQPAEVEQLKKDIEKGEDVTREFVYSTTAASRTGNDYGNTYVEINLTAQTLYLYVNGELKMTTPCTTGTLSKGGATPTGIYGVMYKARDKYLSGGVGRNANAFVNYWMPFYGNYGMHDAQWRSSFGGNYYKTAGSNGCVNLPLASAKTLFNSIEANTPVFIYTSGADTQTEIATANAAVAVENKIASLPETITFGTEPALAEARAAFEALSDSSKELVSNIGALENDEVILQTLKDENPEAYAAYLQQQSEQTEIVEGGAGQPVEEAEENAEGAAAAE